MVNRNRIEKRLYQQGYTMKEFARYLKKTEKQIYWILANAEQMELMDALRIMQFLQIPAEEAGDYFFWNHLDSSDEMRHEEAYEL